MSDFRKLGVPFLVIFLSALLTKLISIYLVGTISDTLFKIVVVIALCTFGATLNVSFRKKSKSVWKKVVAVLIIIFLLFMQLNLFTFSQVANVFEFFGIGSFYINMLYIFCGYMLVD